MIFFNYCQEKIPTLLLSNQVYFHAQLRKNLEEHLFPPLYAHSDLASLNLSEDWLKHYSISTFIDLLRFWLTGRKQETEQDITNYYLRIMNIH